MTPHEAAVLALLARARPRLVASLLRVAAGRAIEDEADRLRREPGESIASWAARLASIDSPRRRRQSRPWSAAALNRAADGALTRGRALGLTAVAIGSTGYPPLLAETADPPPLLWLRGTPDDLARPSIAIVGCRAASSHGLAVARRLAGDLAAAGIVIVSGLARGIDSAAHEAAIAAGGRTVAVLGSGHDRLYPPEHAGLAERIAAAGAVISEFPPGTAARAHHFPARNRIVSGLVAGVVVVEAPEKSGALITAGCALEQGREVFAVPGPVPGHRNAGAHALLRDGATLAESADDILRECGLAGGENAGHRGQACSGVLPPALARYPWLQGLPEGIEFAVDDVAVRAGVETAAALAALLELELGGWVQRVGGGRFVRSPNRVLT